MIWLQQHFYYFIFWIFILGLIIGSFLNVVIYRLPIMLKNRWREQCQEYLQITVTEKDPTKINLAWPNSHCTSCKKKLKPYHNIPLLSYILLRGKCDYCDCVISWQYPVVELITAALSVIVAFHFGFTYQCFAFLLLTYALICLSFIDLSHQILPDTITVTFIWLGLFLNVFGIFTTLSAAVIGALAGYLSLWIINFLFRIVRRKEGIGYGDFKLFALFGAWFGWQLLPIILLVSAALAAIIGIILVLTKRVTHNNPIPFGPYLALVGWIVALWGQS